MTRVIVDMYDTNPFGGVVGHYTIDLVDDTIPRCDIANWAAAAVMVSERDYDVRCQVLDSLERGNYLTVR